MATKAENLPITDSQPLAFTFPLYTQFTSTDPTNVQLGSTVFTIEKKLHISGPTLFKPILCKSQQQLQYINTKWTHSILIAYIL